jgi:alpha-L-arabinofuranosidase
MGGYIWAPELHRIDGKWYVYFAAGDKDEPFRIRTYDVRVEVRGRKVALFLDGQKWGEFNDDSRVEPFRQVVTRDLATGELIVKVVNAQDNAAHTKIDLGVPVASTARVTTLQGRPDDINTEFVQPIKPRTSQVSVRSSFSYTFPPNSITVFRVKDRSRK